MKPNEDRLIQLLTQLRSVPPRSKDAARQGRTQFLAQIESLPAPAARPAPKALRGPGAFAWLRLAGMRAVALLALAALLLSGTGVAYASQGALPNDALFPVKRFIEDLRLTLSSDDAADARLLLGFTQQRVDEMAGLVARQRFDDLAIPAEIYTDQLMQLVTIIVEYKQAGDPRAEDLLLALIAALDLQDSTLTSLLSSAPELEGSEVEGAASLTRSIATQQAPAPLPATAEFRGTLDSLSAGEAVVCGVSFSLAAGTEFEGIPQPGDPVKVDFAAGPSGFVASKVDVEGEPEECELRVEGPLALRGDLSGGQPWQVSGIDFFVDGSTDLRDDPLVGELVQLRAIPLSGGAFLATRIESDAAESRSEAEAEASEEADEPARLKDIEPDKAAQGQTLSIRIEAENSHFGPGTQLSFQPSSGIQVTSLSVLNPTTLVANLSIASNAALGDRQVIVSTQGEVAGGEKLRIEAPKAGDGDEDNSGSGGGDEDEGGQAELKDLQPDRGNRGQTLNVVIIGEDSHFSSSSKVSFGAGITVNSISVQSATRLTANITISSGAALGKRNVLVTTGSEVAGGEQFEVRSGSSGGGSATPTPDSDDDDDEAQEVRFTGVVQSISSGSWKVGGKTVKINSSTEIKDNPQVGDEVEVRALQQPDGSLVAEKIEKDD